MNHKNLNQLVKTIEAMNKEDQIQILSIFKNHNVEITENNNGSFIDLTVIDSSVLEELRKYVEYVHQKKDEINIIETQKEHLKKQIKETNVL